jgi:hypothetical protein
MMIPDSKFQIPNLLLVLGVIIGLSIAVSAQKRDNLTEKEDMQVREAQELDARMKVYVKVIDRRLQAIFNPTVTPTKESKKEAEKDAETFGDVRTGTISELFWDINKTLDEAIMKIDDAASRDMNNPLFGKAVHILADGCQKWSPQFKAGMDKTQDEKEKGLILNSIEFCQQIIEASAKVSKDVPKKKKN